MILIRLLKSLWIHGQFKLGSESSVNDTKGMSMKQKVAVSYVRIFYALALAAILQSISETANALEPTGYGSDNKLKSVERTACVSNETFRFRSKIMEEDSVVEIVRERVKTGKAPAEGCTNAAARVFIPDLVAGIHNFALSQSGRIIWLVVPTKGGLPSMRTDHKIYPLLLDNATQQYDFLIKRVSVAEDRPGRIFNTINLTTLIRTELIYLAHSGIKIDSRTGRAITELNIESSENDGAMINGKLGTKYSFTFKVWLDERYRFHSSNCVIKEITQNDELSSDKGASATDTGGLPD